MEIDENIDLEILNEKELDDLHRQVHVMYSNFKSGKKVKFMLSEIYRFHKNVAAALIRSGGKHISPIDELDAIELYSNDVLDDYSHLETERTLAKIDYSGNEEGEEIFLKDILNEFGKFKLKEPFIYLVGGICNHGKTKGDIDILIKKSKPKDPIIDIPLKFRIMRQLPRRYWSRLHFLYDDNMHGPFTNYIPLYSLVCDINSKDVFEMAEDFQNLSSISIAEQAKISRKENRIKPFRFFVQPKPVHGRERGEIYSLDSIQRTMEKSKVWRENAETGILVEKKFDGARVQIHKIDDRILIMSEDGMDYTNNLPTIVDELKKIKLDFVVEGEAELWLNGIHQNRSDSAGLLNSKNRSENEKSMRIFLYDCLWFEGKDIHTEPFVERRKLLEKIKSKHVSVSDAKIAKGFGEIKRLANRFMNLPGAEGAMFKIPSYVYELDGKSYQFMKFKKERSIIAKVIAVHRVSGSQNTFYYHCAIKGNTYIGKTFNTNVKVGVGEKLEVVFVDLNQYEDPKSKKTWFNWWAPRVTEKSQKSVTSIEQAKKIVKETSGQIGVKKMPSISEKDSEELEEVLIQDPEDYDTSKLDDKVLLDDHRIVHAWAASIAKGKKLKFSSGNEITKEIIKDLHRKIAGEILKRKMEHNTPLGVASLSELSYKKRFVFQNHWRGKSVHGDLRFEREGHLEGYTLMHQIEGKVDKPVLSIEDAKKEDSNFDNFKINLKTGELKQDKIEIATKAKQPMVWLSMKGLTKSAEPGDPHSRPEPGATRNYPGIFDIIDSGTYEEGARKSDYFEYFMNGKVLKERYVVRILSREKIAKGEKVRTPFIWFFWKAKTETPYVLSSRGISKGYVPEKGRSALPGEWEKKIPKSLRWWEKNLSGEKALSVIKEIRKVLLKSGQLDDVSILESGPEARFETFEKWKKLVNMSEKELKDFYNSDEGKEAGLKKSEASKQGIKSGRESAEWILKMLPISRSFREAMSNWSENMWRWANRQISFISRMSKAKGPLIDEKGNKTRKYLSLLIWGHDPKKESGSEDLESSGAEKVRFKLKHDWWKGQKVIRDLPVEHWSLKFEKEDWTYFTLNKNPLTEDSGITGIKKSGSKKLFDIQGIIKPGESLNPNKKIDMHIDDIDEGNCTIIEDSENFMHVKFRGKKLKGNWIFKKTDPQSNIWLVAKGDFPKVRVTHEFGAPLSDRELMDIMFLSSNNVGVSEISRMIDRPNSTIYDWQQKLNI